MYYLEKDITLETGAVAQCWVICDKKEVLYRQQSLFDENGDPIEAINPSDYVQTGTVILVGYKDVAAWLAGKPAMCKKKIVEMGNLDDYKLITLESLSEYVNIYNACQAVCLQKITATDEFTGAVLKNSDDA